MSIPANDLSSGSRHVWIISKPLQGATPELSSVFKKISQTKSPLSHWGVLVSEISQEEMTLILDGETMEKANSTDLGILWELNRMATASTVHTTFPVTPRTLEAWGLTRATRIASTVMNDEKIKTVGISRLSVIDLSCPYHTEISGLHTACEQLSELCQAFSRRIVSRSSHSENY